MRASLLFALTLCCAPCAQAETKLLFGNAPHNQEAAALCDRVVEASRRGIPQAIRMLEEEVPKFLAKADATGRYDLYAALNTEAAGESGNTDPAWKLALSEWCYLHSLKVGENYWHRRWVSLMHDKYFEAGKYREARAVMERERNRRIESGAQLEASLMKAQGPVYPEFPSIQKRVPKNFTEIQIRDNSYLVSQAQQDMVEGKWRQAMEAAELSAEKAKRSYNWSSKRPKNTDAKLIMTTCTGHWRNALSVVVEGFRFLGLPEMELNKCEELKKFNPREGREIYDVLMAEARALHLRHVLGRAGVEVIDRMKEIRATQLSDAYKAYQDADRVYLMIADIHFRQGNAELGWAVFEELRSNPKLTRDMRFIVDSEWCRHRVDTGLYEGVEDSLIALLKIAREGGLKQREIGLYEIYAKLLIGLGRYDDALFIQRELLRLLRSFDLSPRMPAALQQLAAIHALMGKRKLAEANLEEAKRLLDEEVLPGESKKRLRRLLGAPLPNASDDNPGVVLSDLQPIRSYMVPLEGLPARGVFTLANYSAIEIAGELRFEGKGLALGKDASEIVARVNVSAPGGEDVLVHRVVVPAGGYVDIDLTGHQDAGVKPATVDITWQPEGGNAQSSQWITDEAEKGVPLAITDAGEYMDNPFYLIPIHHILQYKDDFAQVVDVRVLAKQPARIELYDSNNELVLVDADGDGKFESEGDFITKDFNRNGKGDMVLAADKTEKTFWLYVRPLKEVAEGELQLDLQIFSQGEWVTHATDKILFPAK